MISSNPIPQVCNYGSSAVYCTCPSDEQIANGTVPLDSLPAAWWNWLWSKTNTAVNCARYAAGVLIDEVNTVLTQAGVCVNPACVDQLYRAINTIRQTIGTADVAGAVKSSSTASEVAIDPTTGKMSVNCLGNAASLTTTASTVVGAINELKSTYDSCISSLNTAVGGKAPTSHASSANTYGVGTASNYGHLKISDTYNDANSQGTDVAASQKAAYCIYTLANGKAAVGSTAGCALGTAAAGTATTAARSDHVHPMPTLVACASCNGSGTAFGDAATRGVKTLTAKGDTGYNGSCVACQNLLVTTGFMSYWNGAYSGSNSNLTYFCGGTFGSAAACAATAFAAKSHASTTTDYGVGSTANYGHLKVCDTYTSSSNGAATNAVAASQCAVYLAYANARNFGNTDYFSKFQCACTAEAAAADCNVIWGLSRSYRWCACPTNVCSYDRRTYGRFGLYQCQNACAGYAYVEVCNWQCCYSGTAGVTTCSCKRFYFKSDGTFCSPIHAASDTFGAALRTCRTGSTNMASVSFYNCSGLLGHLALGTANSNFKRYKNDNSTSYDIYDSSMTIPVANGGTGATTAAAARTCLGLGSAATKATSDFLAATGCAADSKLLTGKAPSALCVACAGANGSGTAFGSAATVNTGTAANCIPLIGTALGTTNNNIVVTDTAGKLKPSGTTLGTAAGCASTAFRASTWWPNSFSCGCVCAACDYGMWVGIYGSSTYGCLYVCYCYCCSAGGSKFGKIYLVNCTGTDVYMGIDHYFNCTWTKMLMTLGIRPGTIVCIPSQCSILQCYMDSGFRVCCLICDSSYPTSNQKYNFMGRSAGYALAAN